jgi:hypothetical protein
MAIVEKGCPSWVLPFDVVIKMPRTSASGSD